MSFYFADGRDAVEPVPLSVGQRIKLRDGTTKNWTVQAVSEHFAACVQQVPFEPRGTLRYTVLDWRNGVRGPCDLIGNAYGDGSYSARECAGMLQQFEDGELSVSQRNWVRLAIVDSSPADVGAKA